MTLEELNEHKYVSSVMRIDRSTVEYHYLIEQPLVVPYSKEYTIRFHCPSCEIVLQTVMNVEDPNSYKMINKEKCEICGCEIIIELILPYEYIKITNIKDN